jgi:glutathione synthase/RimK-type ligase-like ATP-grasp enzyme
MILIITHKEDYTADFVIEKLNARRIPYYRFNCEDCLNMNLSVQYDGLFPKVLIDGHSEFRSIWYRRTKLPIVSAQNREEQLYLVKETDAFMHNLFGLIKGRWLSDPFSIEKAENKFLQLAIAKRIGLLVPDTIIGTSRSKVKEFIVGHEKVIVKPISSGRVHYKDGTAKLIFSNVVPTATIESFEEFDYTPAIFQEYIDKEYEVRVTIVDRRVFSAKVESQLDPESAIDWRRKKRRFEPFNLSGEIEEKCFQLMNELGIGFGAFDFIKSKSGEFWFLEVNPNGQWVWIERDTDLKISEAIINFLS